MKGTKHLQNLKKWLESIIRALLFWGTCKKRGGHMFIVDEKDKTIHLTRGDAAILKVGLKNKKGETKSLNAGNVVRFKVTDKKGCGRVYLQKDVKVEAETSEVRIPLTRDETKIGEIISKPKDYWYEVEINPDTAPQTPIGYDKDGAKILRLYPEGGDIE